MSTFYRFTKFHLENYPPHFNEKTQNCLYHNDFVAVIDESDLISNNSEGLRFFCGVLDTKLPEFVSKTNSTYVQFISDSSRSGEGFKAEIKFTYGKVVHFLIV